MIFKEVGNIHKELTSTQRAYLQERNNDLFYIFSDVVKKNRDLTDEEFERVSDGKFYFAERAKDLGLIDEVGGLDAVKSYIGKNIGEQPEESSRLIPTHYPYPINLYNISGH